MQVHPAYRWFCKLGIEDAIPDHSAFLRARNERFRQGHVFRRVFERVVEPGMVAPHRCSSRREVNGSMVRLKTKPQAEYVCLTALSLEPDLGVWASSSPPHSCSAVGCTKQKAGT